VTEPLGPVSRGERIATLDVLRGFALFGVLLAYTFWSLGTAPEETWTPIDRALAWMQETFVDGKFMTLFSFLFGLGFAVFLERASARSADPVPTYVRRLAVLLVIGLVHALTLRDGDILAPYAILGFFLLLFRRASNRVLAIAFVVLAFLPPVATWAIAHAGIRLPKRPDETGLGWFQVRYAYVRYWYAVNPIYWPYNLALFLAGLWAGRRRIFENLPERTRLFRGVLFAGLLVGFGAHAARVALLPAGANAPPTPERRLALDCFDELPDAGRAHRAHLFRVRSLGSRDATTRGPPRAHRRGVPGRGVRLVAREIPVRSRGMALAITDVRPPPADANYASGRLSGRKNSRMSRARSSGSSNAAKCPPRGISVQRRTS
jgi:hypothetical protein